jgi:hypothetical protein
LTAQANSDLSHVLVNYRVPLKDGRKMKLRAVNWPKGFYVVGHPQADIPGPPKAQLLTLLSQHSAPRTAEVKYFQHHQSFRLHLQNPRR